MQILVLTALLAGCMATTEENLQFFDQNQLSAGFRRYQVAGCSDEVNTCMREIHEDAARCVDLWKQQAGQRFTHCVRNDPVVVNSSRDWQVPSLKWHKAMDQCLSGAQAPSQQTLESWAIQSAAMAYYGRRKRDTAASEAVTQCWRSSRQKKEQCKEKAARCTQFSHCYGEGPEPSNESAKRWYNYVKRLRTETQEKSKTHIAHMGHCLRNEPHTGHGAHHHRI